MFPKIAALFLLGTVTASLATAQTVPLDQPSLWEKPPQGVSLSQDGNFLKIAYDIDISEPRRIKHLTVYEADAFLQLRTPVLVPADAMRIVFAARGQDGSAESRSGTVFLRPVLEDEHGERFSYEPFPIESLKSGDPKSWALWTTRPFLNSEAGGAAPNIYVASGGDGNSWPDGKLRLVGFEMRLRVMGSGREPGRKKGSLILGDVKFAPLQMQDEKPEAFVDAFLSDKGKYHAVFELSPAFQSPPIAVKTYDIDFDPADEASRSRKLSVPEADQLANSWVRYRFTDEKGQIVSDGSLRWHTDLPPGDVGTPLDLSKPPAIGRIRLNPDRFTDGLYPEGEPIIIQARVYDGDGSKLRWKLLTMLFDETIKEGAETIKGGNVSIPVSLPEGHRAARFQYELVGKGGVIEDQGEFRIGIAGPVQPLHSRTGLIPDRNEIKKAPYNRITFHIGDGGKTADERLQRFSETLQQAGDFCRHVTVMIDLADIEPLPGVFDLSLMDRIMDIAADNAFGVTVRLAHAEAKTPFVWQPFTKVRDFDGAVIGGHYIYKGFSMADGDYMKQWVRAFRALRDRYNEHPAFEGYYLMMPVGEWILPEEVWHGKIADYSWRSRAAFRDYLKKLFSLEELNKRWQTSYASWDEVDPPQPQWELGKEPDLRPAWMDFNHYKMEITKSWCVGLGTKIREFDDRRIIISYGNPVELTAPNGDKPIDYAHNGGNHVLKDEGRYIEAWDNGKGIGWITEPHHPHRWAAYGDPAQQGRVLDWSVFVMLSQAGAGGTNLHVYYFPNPTYALAAHYGGEFAYDRLEQYKPILTEMHGAEVISLPKQVGAFDDSSTLFAKHRTTFTGRLHDLRRWFELLTMDSVPWEYADPKKSYQALFLNPMNEVLDPASITYLDDYIRQGGTLVMAATTGKRNAADASAEYPLLKQLGLGAPVGKFTTTGDRVKATILPDFRKKLGDREDIAFYSQTDMARELVDPQIGANFNVWPYRWLPQSDYFGYFADNKLPSGEVLAKFPDGGTALSRHQVGKGTAYIFWGTPDQAQAAGLLGALTTEIGVKNPRSGNAIPYMLEAFRKDLNRHYALLYEEKPGTYKQKLSSVPDGKWFVDDMVTGQRLGTFSGQTMREEGLDVAYYPGMPPLKVLRLSEPKGISWLPKYPDSTTPEKP